MSTTRHDTQVLTHQLQIRVVGTAMSLFLVCSFLFCIALGSVSTRADLHNAWFTLLPGVTWLSWRSVAVGIVETIAYGWFIAVVYVPLYNWALRRRPNP
jgi:hypothetical protein